MSQQPVEAEKEEMLTPSWYGEEVVDTDSSMVAYAAAIDDDSAAAVSKSVSGAEADLKAYLSDKLEEIRSEAIEEYGSASGLNSPGFLIALRKADGAIDDLVATGNTGARQVKGYDSYRGFAEVGVPKEELIEQLDEQLASHEKAWNAMKGSKAFQNF